MKSEKFEVVYPFTLDNKVYLPKQIVSESIFVAHGKMLSGLLERGFIKVPGTEGVKGPEAIKPVEPLKSTPINFDPPKAIEIKNDADLVKAIEPEKAVETPTPEDTSKKGRGKK